MHFQRLMVLLPSAALEDFPAFHTGEDAHSLLAAWTAPWHPAFIAHVRDIPRRCSTEDAASAFEGALVLAPKDGVTPYSHDTAEAIRKGDGCLVAGYRDRDKYVTQALGAAQLSATIEDEMVADFFALGYWYLQIELLTRQMSYGSNIDDYRLREQAVAAAEAAVAGDEVSAREHLGRGFSVLADERDHYYPVDSYLLDLTLVSDELPAAALDHELSASVPLNVWLTSRLLARLDKHHPETVRQLRHRIADGTLALIGGERSEPAWPLQSAESMLRHLAAGVADFQQLVGSQPRVFFRRRFGMTPLVPAVLARLGYLGSVHATLDEGQFPKSTQARAKWQAADRTPIDSVTCIPLDASRPETFLRLALRMGESMERDHVATLCLAHWAGHTNDWYDAVRRGTQYGLALGKFVTLDDYFQQSTFTVQEDHFPADQYRSPYLQQSLAQHEADPISRWVRYWQSQQQLEAALHLDAWTTLLDAAVMDDADSGILSAASAATSPLAAIAEDVAAEFAGFDAEDVAMTQRELQQAAGRFAHTVCQHEAAEERGWLVVNPHTAACRCNLELSPLPSSIPRGQPVYAAEMHSDHVETVADIPPTGFAWIDSKPQSIARRRHRTAAIVSDEFVLENEFLTAHVDQNTGGLRALYDHRTRGNRLSQKLAAGAAMADCQVLCNDITVDHSSTVRGEITSRGNIVDRDQGVLAEFRQHWQLWRGSRVLQLRIWLHPVRQPVGDPWRDYFGCRFAHPGEADQIFRAVNGIRSPSSLRRSEAPLYVDITESRRHTTILTNGLPFHNRVGPRMIDSLLIVAGETCRDFQLGIGVDVADALSSAVQQLVPLPVLPDQPRPVQETGWLFHISASNVMATSWQPLQTAASPPNPEQRGFRVRLLEAGGSPTRFRLKALRPIHAAWRCDHQGQADRPCDIRDGAVELSMAAHEWIEILVEW